MPLCHAFGSSRRSMLLCLVAALLLPKLAPASPSSGTAAARASASVKTPEQVIKDTIDQLFAILRDPALAKDPKRRMQALRAVVDEAFDWQTMARSSLGPHWRKLNEQQRSDFILVFKELLAQQYMADIDRFQVAVTSVVISHDMTQAFRLADCLHVLDKGRLVASGPPLELRAQPGSLAAQYFEAGRTA